MTILVVGAGVVGCAIAYELAARGARVRMLDARGAAQGATRASAGMLAPHVEGHLEPLRALGVKSLELYDSFVGRVVADSGQAVEYERSGTLQVALDGSESADLCALARALAAAGVDHALLDAAEARRLEPALRESATGGLLIREHGYVAAEAFTTAAATAAARHGAELETERVVSIHGGDPPRVVTSGGTIEADAVVLSAGTWSAALVAAADAGTSRAGPAVKPIRGQLLQVRLAARPASRILWGRRCYVVPRRDGTVLVGATSEDAGFDERATASGVRDLLAAGIDLIPALESAAFDGVRVGLRPMTPDELPAIGASSTMRGVFHATGHYRNGVLLAPLTAALMADLLLEGREGPELALVRPARLGL